MNMKKIATSLAIVFFIMPSISFAATLTSGQIQSILSLLSSFGADSATIANVQAALTGIPSTNISSNTGSATSSCTFTKDLTLKSSGSDVTCLQQALITNGYSIPAGATGYFGAQTQAAVMAWQKANSISSSSGVLDSTSRARWNLGNQTSSSSATNTTTQNNTSPAIPLSANSSSKLDLNFFAQVVVKLQCGNEWGSGTIINRNGSTATIFTNKHVTGNATTCNVYAATLANSSNPPALKWTATVSSVDPVADLALLTINNFPSAYPVLLDQNRFCSTSEYTPGQHMTVIGYPATVGGDPTQSTLNISSGDISGLDGNGLVSKSTAFIDGGSSGGAAISDSNCYFGMPTAEFYRASASNELSGLGEVINIAAVINTDTFAFANLTAGNIADYVPSQQPQQTIPIPTPSTPNAPSPSLPPLAISNVQVISTDWQSATISWSTNQLYFTPSIEYSTNSDLSNSQTFSNSQSQIGGMGCLPITPGSTSENCKTIGSESLVPNTTYYFRIIEKSVDTGETANSDIMNFKTATPPIPAKFNFSISNITSDSAGITCSIISETDHTVTGLQLDTSNAFTNPKNIQTPLGFENGFTLNLTGLAKNTTYYYRLGFTDMSGNQFYSDTGSFTTLDIAINNIQVDQITTSSAHVTGALSLPSNIIYQSPVRMTIQYGTDGQLSTPQTGPVTGGGDSAYFSYSFGQLSSNTTYYFRIVAKDLYGNESDSDVKSFTTLAQ
jgi:peptidoglycan hydrolase-like protein with peptidoglycan-binding domain